RNPSAFRAMHPLVVASLAGVAAAASLVGCANISGVDREIQRLIEKRSAALGEDAAAPNYEYRDPRSVEATRPAYEETPSSENPDAGDLPYEVRPPADAETRLRRLDRYLDTAAEAVVVDLPGALRIAQR